MSTSIFLAVYGGLLTLVEKLTEWNGGKERGAAARLAREVEAAPNLVSMWMGGTMPGEKYAAKICKVLKVSQQQLGELVTASKKSMLGHSVLRDAGVMLERQTGYQFLEIPFLGVVSASRFTFSFDLPPENFTTLAIKGNPGDRYAVLRISGDCMTPTIDDGDEVLIKQVVDVADGSIAIVSFDGECTLKRVYKKKDGLELRADNKEYKPRLISSSKVRVLAEVVKIMKDPRRKP